jgi:hypothetical protein
MSQYHIISKIVDEDGSPLYATFEASGKVVTVYPLGSVAPDMQYVRLPALCTHASFNMIVRSGIYPISEISLSSSLSMTINLEPNP